MAAMVAAGIGRLHLSVGVGLRLRSAAGVEGHHRPSGAAGAAAVVVVAEVEVVEETRGIEDRRRSGGRACSAAFSLCWEISTWR